MTKTIESKELESKPSKKKDGYKPKETKDSGVTTKWIGHRTLIDKATGEQIELEYIEKSVRHTLPGGWQRVYLDGFLEIYSGLYASGRKIDVVDFILRNLNSENQLCYTQNQVIEKTGVSRPVVVETYKYLIENDFMKKQGSVFVVNPKYVCAFGSDKKNASILVKYKADDPTLF